MASPQHFRLEIAFNEKTGDPGVVPQQSLQRLIRV